MKSMKLRIDGMKCEGCASTVSSALENVEGVQRAQVSLEGSEARVIADDSVDPSDLEQAVSDAGYEARPSS